MSKWAYDFAGQHKEKIATCECLSELLDNLVMCNARHDNSDNGALMYDKNSFLEWLDEYNQCYLHLCDSRDDI